MKYLILLLYGFIAANAYTQPINYKAVDSLMYTAQQEGFSGVLLMAEKGKITYEQAFGWREEAKQIPLQTTDIFELASVSKQFTAMVIMMLQEKGLLQYDDSVSKYLNIPYTGITIRHLLTHTSGLPDYQAIMDRYWDKTKVAGNEDIIAYLNKYAPPALFTPGQKYAYSNTGYVLLASIAEKASGKDFTAFTRKKIFRRAGMKHADIRTPAAKAGIDNFAVGHMYVPLQSRYVRADSFPSSNYTIWLGNREGPGRISATARDLMQWDKALYTNKLVHQNTIAQAYTPMRLTNGTYSYYGFGWDIDKKTTAGKVVSHNGDNPGYKTQIIRYIDQRITVILLCNNAHRSFEKIVQTLQHIITR